MAAKKKAIRKWTAAELDAGAARGMKAWENIDGSRSKKQRAAMSDSLGMIQKEEARRKAKKK